MASPQKEHGYTAIANEILEAMARIKLSPTQYRILFIVWRYTYGFNRKEHELSLSFLSTATGCDKRQLQRELKSLDERKVIIQEIKNGSFRKIKFNKYYSKWVGETDIGEIDIGETDIGESVNATIGESVNATIGETDNQERKKENIKEIYDYYLSLDLIKHRTFTADMKKAIEAAMKNNKYSIEYCKKLLDRHKAVVDLTKCNKDYKVIARSLSEFFGQKVANAKHLICSEYDESGKYYEKYIRAKEEKPKNIEEKIIRRDDY